MQSNKPISLLQSLKISALKYHFYSHTVAVDWTPNTSAMPWIADVLDSIILWGVLAIFVQSL